MGDSQLLVEFQKITFLVVLLQTFWRTEEVMPILA